MLIPFDKYQGTGNDFIIIDDRNGFFPESNIALIQNLCDRKFGIGSDGLMLIRNCECDFEMIFFNPDGSKSLCGNGSRCAVHFAHKLGLAGATGIFITTDGKHDYKMNGQNIAIRLHDVPEQQMVLDHFFINTGMFDGVKSRFSFLLPILDETRVTDKIIRAIEKKKERVITPPMVYTLFPLRLLPVPVFDWIANVMGINATMKNFIGRK